MTDINFLQVGNGHCFICHIDTKPNDKHALEHLFTGAKIKRCYKSCDPKWQKSWDELVGKIPENEDPLS